MHAPQFICLGLLCLGLGISLADHGKPKTGTVNFVTTLISNGLLIALLWWGGFFSQP